MDMDFEVMQASITDFPRMVASDDDQQMGYFGDEHLWDERKEVADLENFHNKMDRAYR
jgi:hypothetical protein